MNELDLTIDAQVFSSPGAGAHPAQPLGCRGRVIPHYPHDLLGPLRSAVRPHGVDPNQPVVAQLAGHNTV